MASELDGGWDSPDNTELKGLWCVYTRAYVQENGFCPFSLVKEEPGFWGNQGPWDCFEENQN